ncbi:FecCD family ABC transporter permease [Alteromonas gilva]|uniref:Iron chelate uptake ABC transporter family permease subunit n=1 Tax=Alteromonas gilva TaxID=2987522 RepID=A0ABT5L401_9ALTE|nr:iron chelate uptake ABC transporter family permease subunit [Alteromonas gilva]MDC8831768.1 iron chelate uptake ABC transporter family permease subunit [Alteromonas gilva]
MSSAQRARYMVMLSAAVVLCAGLILVNSWQRELTSAVNWHILLRIQLPLITTAILVGVALCTSSAALQVVLRNPLADPGVIGIASGASLVAAGLLILLPTSFMQYLHYMLPAACFAGALLSTWLIFMIARRLRGFNSAVILAGIALTTIAGALMGWLYLIADAQSMRNLTFWIMGSLHQADGWILMVAAPLIVSSFVYLVRQAPKLNRLYAGDTTAKSVGVDPQKLGRGVLIAAALSVGCAVAIAGSIAFLGLLIPHYLRLRWGYDNRFILPASGLCGAITLLLVALSSEVVPYATLPVSMVTATIGGPLLLLALTRGQFK